MKTTYDMIIIGGGISGLSLAYLLCEMDRNVLVIDKAPRLGGAIQSISHEDFSIDLGAHTGYNSYYKLSKLIEDTPLQHALKKRIKQKYFFVENGNFKGLTSPIHWGELLWNIVKIFKAKQEGKSVREYYSLVVGKSNYADFAQHFFKAVLCQDASNYPSAFFLKRRKKRNKSFPKSFTFPQGMEAIINGFEKAERVTTLTATTIKSITKKDGFTVETEKGTFYSPDLSLACYADESARLITSFAPELASLLAKISYTTVSSLGIITRKENLKTRLFAGLLTRSSDFCSIVSRDIIENENYRGFTIHAQGIVAEEKLQKLLCSNLGICEGDILFQQYRNTQLPQLKKGHEDFVATLVAQIQEVENLYITGNYFKGLSLEDCVQRSEQEAIRYISTPQKETICS